MRTFLTLAVTATLALGCKKKGEEGSQDKPVEPPAAKAAEKSAPSSEPVEAQPAKEIALPPAGESKQVVSDKLQGTWRRGPAKNPTFLFEVKNDTAKLTTQSKGEAPSITEGKLGIEPTGGTLNLKGRVYDFHVDGDQLYMRFGGSIDSATFRDDDNLKIAIGAQTMVRKNGKCHYSNTRKKVDQDVECSVSEAEGQKIFLITIPDPGWPSSAKDPPRLVPRKFVLKGRTIVLQHLLNERYLAKRVKK